MSCTSLHLGKNDGVTCVTASVDKGALQTCIKGKTPPDFCIKGKCILCSVTGSQDFPGGQDFAGGQGHWRASRCRRASFHGGQGRASRVARVCWNKGLLLEDAASCTPLALRKAGGVVCACARV